MLGFDSLCVCFAFCCFWQIDLRIWWGVNDDDDDYGGSSVIYFVVVRLQAKQIEVFYIDVK